MTPQHATVYQPTNAGSSGTRPAGLESKSHDGHDGSASLKQALCVSTPSATPVFRHVSTDDVSPDCRLDYWQSLFATSRMEYPHGADHHGFHGELTFTTPWQGVAFLHLGNSALTCHFGGSDPDSVILLRIHTGVVYARHGRDALTSVSAATGLMLFDQDRPLVTTDLQPVTMTGLKLPRSLVSEALGAQLVIREQEAVRPFLHSGALLHGLLQHLEAMAQHASRPDVVNVADAMSTARSIVMTLLARHNPRRRSLSEAFDDALLAAAHYQLDLHAGDPNLTAEQVAAMLGCSRAHLYHLFQHAGETVADILRQARMDRASRLLKSTDWSIGAIAMGCGYADFSAFGKAFRRYFGMTPSDFRHQAGPARA